VGGRGHNTENHIHFYSYKRKIFSSTSRQISIKLDRNHPWVKGILNLTNKGPGPLQRGDNPENEKKIGEVIEKVFPSEPLSQNSSYLHESFLR
jgi:hypothetical protein